MQKFILAICIVGIRRANSAKLVATDPQNVVFNWAPQHLGSPNSAFSTEYDLKLVEIWPNGRDPYEAMQSTPALYEATTQATSLVYDVMCPLLTPGKEYAFNVRAKDVNGLDLFKNDGYSETYMFTFGDECKPPTSITAKGVNGPGLEMDWTSGVGQTAYNINYRLKGGATWYSSQSLTTSASIYQLPANTDIEYQINSVCGTVESAYSDIYTGRTPADDTASFKCGGDASLPAITNFNPMPKLSVGSVITAGGYTATITSVSGGSGVFTGECLVEFPFFRKAKVAHTFKDIKVNELGQLYEGKLVSKYNPNSAFLTKINTSTETTASTDGEADNTYTVTGDTVKYNTGISSIEEGDDGEVLVIDTNGDTTYIEHTDEGTLVISPTGDTTTLNNIKEISIKDETGNQYLVSNNSISNVNSLVNNSNPDTTTNSNNYVIIKGVKFKNGSIVYLPKSIETITIEAYESNGKTFPDSTKWTGITGLKSKSTYDLSNASTSASGINIIATSTDSGKLISVSVNLVVVEIKFKEPSALNYGYDDNQIKQYPSYLTIPKKGINWKTVESNNTTDDIAIEIIPSGVERNIYFLLEDSINFSITPKIPITSTQNISVSGSVDKKETVLKPKIGCFITDSMQIKIKSFDKVYKELVVILVNEQNDDIQLIPLNQGKPNTPAIITGSNNKIDSNPVGDDVIINDTLMTGVNGICETQAIGDDIQLIQVNNGESGQIGVTLGGNNFRDTKNTDIKGDDQIIIQNGKEIGISVGINGICETSANSQDVITTNVPIAVITNRINELYKQGVVEWKVDQTIITKTINFDLNRDGKLDVSSWTTNEMNVIIDSCKTNDSKYNLFLVDNPNDGSSGYMNFSPNRYGFIHPNEASSPETTCAHELGHGAFKLKHPFEEFNSQGFIKAGTDIWNIMNYGPARDKFRKYQWDLMH